MPISSSVRRAMLDRHMNTMKSNEDPDFTCGYFFNTSPVKRSASQKGNWLQKGVTSSGIAENTKQGSKKHKVSNNPTENVFTSKFSIRCCSVLIGNMQTLPQNVHFNDKGLWFHCPDYSFEKLYVVMMKYEDMESAFYAFRLDMQVVYFSPKPTLQMFLAKYLCNNNNNTTENFSEVMLMIENEDYMKLKAITCLFPPSVMKVANFQEAGIRVQLHKPTVVATKESMKPLLSRSAPAAIHLVLDCPSTASSQDSPRYQDENQNISLGRSAEYLNPTSSSVKDTSIKRTTGGKIPPTYNLVPRQNKIIFSKVPSPDKISCGLRTRAVKPKSPSWKEHTFLTKSPSPLKVNSLRSRAVALLDPAKELALKSKKCSTQPEVQKKMLRTIIFDDSDSEDEDSVFKFPSQSCSTRSQRKKNEQANENYYVVYPPPPARGVVVLKEDLNCLRPTEWLNDTIVDFWCKHVFCSCTDEEQARILIFSTYFCTLLAQNSSGHNSKTSDAEHKYQRARRWTRHEDIFAKEFLLIPVNTDNLHWFLVAVCYPNKFSQETLLFDATSETSDNDDDDCDQSKILEKRPCFLVFDSLPCNRDTTIENLRQFLELEHESRKGCRLPCKPKTMPTIHVKVPEQTNGYDCGVFVLQYLQTFCDTLLKNFSVPLRTLEHWFQVSEIKEKRKDVLQLLHSIHEEQELGGVLQPRPGAIVGLYEGIYSP